MIELSFVSIPRISIINLVQSYLIIVQGKNFMGKLAFAIQTHSSASKKLAFAIKNHAKATKKLAFAMKTYNSSKTKC